MEIGNAVVGLLMTALPAGEAPWGVVAGLVLTGLLLFSPLVRDLVLGWAYGWVQPVRRRREHLEGRDEQLDDQ